MDKYSHYLALAANNQFLSCYSEYTSMINEVTASTSINYSYPVINV